MIYGYKSAHISGHSIILFCHKEGFILSLPLSLLVGLLPLSCYFLSQNLGVSDLLKWSCYLCFGAGTEDFPSGCLNKGI